MISRRQLLSSGVALTGLSSWSLIASEQQADKALFASAFSLDNTLNFFTVFNQEGEIKWQQALPERAHAPIVHPNKAIIAIVSRRPGFYIDIYDVYDGKLLQRITPEVDHHFYGHGLFTLDGLFLITQENHYPSGEGKIFVRSVESGEVVNTFPSYGIGPHESILLNSDTLVVANGGIKTHPDNDRRILNLESMQANLAFISLSSGELLNKISLPDEFYQLSIRHLDANKDGVVALGFQYQGDKWDDVPLTATATLESTEFSILALPYDVKHRLQQYCGSVTFDQSGKTLAISSPRGDLVVYWDLTSGNYLTHHNFQDVCGLARTNNKDEFLITTGKGKRIFVNPTTNTHRPLARMAQWKWDNHIHKLMV